MVQFGGTNYKNIFPYYFIHEDESECKDSVKASLPMKILSICYRFDGRVVAKLPFYPLSWMQGLSHRNLPGDDYTECSFIFLYILCTMSIR